MLNRANDSPANGPSAEPACFDCSRNFPILIAVLSLVAALAVAPGRAIAADANFVSWIAAFRQTALQANVHAAVFDAVFAGIDEPDPDVIAAANYQPEFTDKIWEYMDNRITESIVAKGRELRQQNKAWLDQVERRFGVDRDILLAIWSMETSYGDALATGKGIRKVARSLATLGYADSTAGEIRPDTTYCRAEDRPEWRCHGDRTDRFLGRRDGPHAVYPDQLSELGQSISTATASATSGLRSRMRLLPAPTC